MPILVVLSVLAQVFCGVHIFKTGQDRTWLYLIILAPGVGCLIYAIAVLLPSTLSSRQGKQTIRTIQNKLDPTRNVRSIDDQLSIRDTPEVRINMGDAQMELQQYEEALWHYKKALVGHNEFDPPTLLKLANTQFLLAAYDDCLQTLITLLKNNPSFVSPEGHLLQARALHEKGDLDSAEQAYQQVIDYYSGPQAQLYYAKLLCQQKRPGKAKEQLQEILSYARIAPPYYRRFHKSCLAEAKQMLKSLEQ